MEVKMKAIKQVKQAQNYIDEFIKELDGFGEEASPFEETEEEIAEILEVPGGKVTIIK
jgi:hypothetical protein